MFTTVMRLKMNPNWALSVYRFLAGTVMVVLLASAQALAASDPANANGATGEAWTETPNTAPTTGTVATAPAVAPGMTPVTRPPPAPSASAQATPGTPAPQPTADEATDADPDALTAFRPQLDPYGTWVDDTRYGRVWVPSKAVVGQNFSPYVTSGHWALDADDNWIWVSDHPFGWVVFHYGRWFYSTEYGWAWVPGRTYAPNWVVWRLPTSTYAYVGWAPMPPRYGWFEGGAVWYSSYGTVSYVFCPSDYLFYPSVGLYLVHDPWMVSRLGIYTSFYYPPYYYGGYYGRHPHGDYRGGHAGYRPPPYGPPINRTRISPRAIPRERVAADPRAVAAARRVPSNPTSASSAFQRRSQVGTSSPTSRVRSSASPVAPRSVSPVAPRSAPGTQMATPRSRHTPSEVAPAAPRTSVPRSVSPAREPSVRSRSPSVRSSPTFRSPSSSGGRSSSVGGGRRHR